MFLHLVALLALYFLPSPFFSSAAAAEIRNETGDARRTKVILVKFPAGITCHNRHFNGKKPRNKIKARFNVVEAENAPPHAPPKFFITMMVAVNDTSKALDAGEQEDPYAEINDATAKMAMLMRGDKGGKGDTPDVNMSS
jgi:hypothetical protein